LWSLVPRRLQQVSAARHGDTSGARHFEHAVGAQDFEQTVNFIDRARNFDDQGFGSDVNHTATEHFDEFHEMRARLLIGGDFD